MERLKRSHQDKYEDLKSERKKMLESARKQAESILESARSESNLLLNQLEDMKKKMDSENARETVQKAREAAKNSINKLEKNSDYVDKYKENYKLPRDLLLGDSVLLMDIDKKATVTRLPEKDGTLEVMAGIIKMRTGINNVKLIEGDVKIGGKRQASQRKVSGIKSRAERTVQTELDLRGMASDEAILMLDRFIDEAILSGIETIRIIHGKGTGVLKNAVNQHLKKHKSIRTHRLGVFGEGEHGVTIAELK